MVRKTKSFQKCFDYVKTRKKENFPSKTCIRCNRSFEWRKKWKNCWDEVKYCGEKCRRSKSTIEEPDNCSPYPI
ncbi:MAG: DUF2256 domain-containing protein [Flavobacteriales bacterium]|nr:DUF2256 domain-containing protein [Flavobacteriales bacterium]MBT5933352.1 DUF2256 domain-containing protein [Flavobacteriales bacterium]